MSLATRGGFGQFAGGAARRARRATGARGHPRTLVVSAGLCFSFSRKCENVSCFFGNGVGICDGQAPGGGGRGGRADARCAEIMADKRLVAAPPPHAGRLRAAGTLPVRPPHRRRRLSPCRRRTCRRVRRATNAKPHTATGANSDRDASALIIISSTIFMVSLRARACTWAS